ncbi:MAG: hypothetical protein H7318_11110 [Oligoflexus sp.]|nr:hypothetical protein [Oligoflexus sp.]
MRRPALLAVLLGIALLAVLFGKYKLDQSIKEGKFDSTASPVFDADHPMTIDLGVEPDPKKSLPLDQPPHGSAADSHTDVMAALVEARQSFRQKDAMRAEASADPHTTPNSIVKSAEKLGQIITLEQIHPEFKPEFQALYLECSKDSEVLTVTRVQCLEKYIQSKKPSADAENALLAEVDPVVKKLYLEMKR